VTKTRDSRVVYPTVALALVGALGVVASGGWPDGTPRPDNTVFAVVADGDNYSSFDVEVASNEERSRGSCSIDPGIVCPW
jgi:hypothetical protein